MKKILSAIMAVLLLVSLLSGCGSSGSGGLQGPQEVKPSLGTNLSVFPTYENLTFEEKTIFDSIQAAIANHSADYIHIGTYGSQAEFDNAEKRLDQMFRQVVYSCPDWFWVDLYNYSIHSTQIGDTYTLELELKYIMEPAEAAEKKALYEAAVNAIVDTAKEIPDLFDKVLYVYDTLLANTQYDYALAESDDSSHLDLSAYGCLVNGNTICSGYALAFRSIMEKLGIECGVEFNTYDDISLADGHVWNYCKLDGEYYYFDLTWGDTGFDDESYRPYLDYSYLYFGITRDDLEKCTYDLDEDAPTPDCTGTKYNYFIHEGLSFDTYHYDAVKPVIAAHAQDSVICLRFGSYFELEQAVEDLITDQRIFEILTDIDELQYLASDTDLHLLLFLD